MLLDIKLKTIYRLSSKNVSFIHSSGGLLYCSESGLIHIESSCDILETYLETLSHG